MLGPHRDSLRPGQFHCLVCLRIGDIFQFGRFTGVRQDMLAEMPNMRIVIAGGGTGGHIIPALAIANELRLAWRAEILFIGTPRGLESRLVPKAGYPLSLIEVGQLKNVSLLTRARTLLDLPRSLFRCRK